MKSSALKIGNRTYSIAALDDEMFDLILAHRRVINVDIKSFIDHDEQVIFVRSRLQKDHKRELILHELIHACLEDSGSSEDNERFVSVLSPRLICLIDELPSILQECT